MLKKSLAIVILSLVLTVGCMPHIYTETGQRFDATHFDSIKAGVTTKADLQASMGDPQQTGVKESGKEMWTYLFLSLDHPFKFCILTSSSPEIEHEFMRMTLTFDGDKVFEKSYEMSKKDSKKDKKK